MSESDDRPGAEMKLDEFPPGEGLLPEAQFEDKTASDLAPVFFGEASCFTYC